MNILEMSISGAVMILFTIAVRALTKRVLPKRTFTVMWGIASARLLIPYSLPCLFSVYSLFARKTAPVESAGNSVPMPITPTVSAGEPLGIPSAAEIYPETRVFINPMTAVWLTGIAVLAVFFIICYVKSLKRFKEAIPVENAFISEWLAEHGRKNISVRYSDSISSPLTYGIFRPVILIPKNFDRIGENNIKFVLTHEYIHIRRLDALFKLILAAALCVHWFNPLVWVMFFIANRDIELSCDEAVLRATGGEKQAYAMALIRVEETRSGLTPLTNHFSKNPIKERIVSIMKFKKFSIPTIAAAVCLVAVTTTAFATTADNNNRGSTISGTGIADESSSTNSSSSTVFGATARSDDPVIRREGDYDIVYEDDYFGLAVRRVDPPSSDNTSDPAEEPKKSGSMTDDNAMVQPGIENVIYSLKYTAKEGVKCIRTFTFYPGGQVSDAVVDEIPAEKIITFESFEDILFLEQGNYMTHNEYNEDGSITVYYFNTGTEPLDFTNSKPLEPKYYTHEEIVDGAVIHW